MTMTDPRLYLPGSINTRFSEQELVEAAEQSILHLLCYCDEESPVKAALKEIGTHYVHSGGVNVSSDFSRDVLHTLLIQALMRPNSYITTVIEAFKPQMMSFKHVISVGLVNYSNALGIDLSKCFLTIGSGHFKTACVSYGVDPQMVLVEAIATDNPELFSLICSTPPGGAYPYNKWSALARFEDAPDSRIMTECLAFLGVNHHLEIYKARAALLRENISPTGNRQTYLIRNQPGQRPTLYPSCKYQGSATRPDDAETFYRKPEFKQWITENPVDAIKSIYWPTEHFTIDTTEQWATADEVTRIFLDAGVPPIEMITYGPLNRGKLGTLVTLDEALNYLGHLDDLQFRFYVYIYLAYLRTFSIEQIIEESEGSDLTLLAAHKVLRDPRLVEAMDSYGGDEVFSKDLGL